MEDRRLLRRSPSEASNGKFLCASRVSVSIYRCAGGAAELKRCSSWRAIGCDVLGCSNGFAACPCVGSRCQLPLISRSRSVTDLEIGFAFSMEEKRGGLRWWI